MQILATLRESDILPEARDLDPSDFSKRSAARAVVSNGSGHIALLRVGKYNYHKLPGGGVEQDEGIAEALKRELLEEIGCSAKVTAEIGQIIEYRDQWNLQQTSYCFLAEQIGEQVQPSFTDKELGDAFEISWAASISDAITMLQSDVPESYEGQFIRQRDLIILAAAKVLDARP